MRLNRHPAARRARVALLALAAALAALPVGPVSASPLFLSPASEGSWIAADKELHFAGSLAIAASLRVEGRSRGAALGATLSVG
jgi:hypothetical protein